jgi:hypothetical protein
MRFLIAVDVGIKNLGLCVFDFTTAKVVHWDTISLVSNGRYIPANNVQYVRDFVARYQAYFQEAACVVVERQMRCNMRIIESVLQTLFYDYCTIINARSVKAHYGLGTKNYRMNKQRAVQWTESFLENNPSAFAPGVGGVFQAKNKKDDLADSLLLVMYYLDTYALDTYSNPDLLTSVAAILTQPLLDGLV